MKRGSTILLKTVIIAIGLGALAFFAYVLPMGIMTDKTGFYRPILIGMYGPGIPFFIALYQAFRLLGLIDQNQAFSELSANALKKIKYCGVAISIMYAAGMPIIFSAADKDDAPGVVLMGLVIIFASFIIATFAGVLQKLVQSAVDMKSENDLTV
jgi:hypothetical protein